MSKGCDGCSDCCKAIGIDKVSYDREDFLKVSKSIPMGWVRITRRQAKRRNPQMFKGPSWQSKKTFFKCTHLKEYGCEIHQESPYVCSGYPYYGNALEDVKEVSVGYGRNEYSANCNMREEILKVEGEGEWSEYILEHFKNFANQFPDKLHKSRAEFPDRLIPVVNI